MKIRTRKLVAICLMFIFVLFACAALITALNSLTANAEFAGYGTTLSDEELYNSSNTYNVSTITDNKIIYNLNTSNGKTVMEEPQITVLTPGLGGTAAHWSNDYPNTQLNVTLDYDNETGQSQAIDVTYMMDMPNLLISNVFLCAAVRHLCPANLFYML